MTKKKINVMDFATEIMAELKKGVLVTTKVGEKTNAMTISWGMLGIEWAAPIFITVVRQGRFTHEQLEKNPEFTVNIPYGACDRKILGICGTKSGRDTDKIKEAGLTLVEPEEISVPAVKELPLTLECRLVYKQDQGPEHMPEVFQEKFYPQDIDGSHHDRNRDYHTAYYGEIVAAYIIEEDEK